ncbi:hypothetical protein [Caldimonas brevitalea]|uniref:Uncharacterized protein n=1 Tax=Caldimonas brevitalea TaxID=413882 RepID=A0A0G3BQW9_9BURK|nr:hypothetical protein [Caldimonas brevitalea]AKJ31809.1 hypothetical protein AAW51_5118 [Caldimonas brevitalea]
MKGRHLTLAALLLAALTIVWWQRREPVVAPAAAAQQPDVGWRTPSPFGNGPAAQEAPVATTADDDESPVPSASAPATDLPPPRGMSASQWAQLQDSLRDHPERDAEIARVADYMAYQHTLDLYQAQRAQGAPLHELQPLARELDAGLEQRITRGEMSLPEAQLLKSALLDTLQPDATQRTAALDAWRRRHTPPPPAADPRVQAYQRQESALVAAWQALPPSQRQPQQLQTQLDALRQSVFGDGR